MPVSDAVKTECTRLAALLDGASRAVVFTGAGISTESGIPDFRSPGGLWTRYRPIEFADFLHSAEKRAEAWRRKFAIDDATRGAAPNRTHHAIARLVERGMVACVVTQNIDGLHQAAGVPPERVIELHGNGTYATCLDCGQRYELDWVRTRLEARGAAPDCPACGGRVKSATVSFGQALPAAAIGRAQDAALDADLFLVLGSSLVVYPAAGLPVIAKEAGATLAIVNREPTGLDAIADLVIHAELGDVFEGFVNIV